MKRRDFIQAVKCGTISSYLFSNPLFTYASRLAEQTFAQKEKELAYHTITAVKFGSVELKWPRKVGKNARLDDHGFGETSDICVIQTDHGASGWGMVRGKKEAEQILSRLSGKKVSDVFNTQIGITDMDYLPYDIALHDLAGVILQKPVYAVMGAEQPTITDCYSGMLYFDDLDPKDNPAGINKVVEECQQDYDLGYRQFKLKIGRGNKWMPKQEGVQRDIEITKAVAKQFPDCAILVDGNDGFTVEEFIQYLEGIGDIPLFWIEEPFLETAEDYRKLRAWLHANNIKNTLLADGEHNPDDKLLRELEEQKLIDVHLTDILGYGFTPWRQLMPELKQMGILASPHAWGTLLKTHYTAHLTGALGNTPTIEGVTCSSDDVDLSNYRLENGKLIPSTSPGFGMPLLKKI
ncbi:mandelate racemase/muconate lactonizing protein [Olivibacter sp. SDN3]|uniref:enolase C-terminal domain-like protein n=1 Tax=Olivibacter sp. SDN3 TaxID=2764720 RepID=UPI001651A405|nr:enolase C-terminal domain-like protein [Olivibacter sp. SDN3]QNL48223.1 mandelate racemase/muconate lactonizing protein [Olivibacter sp. SDN3]